MSPSNRVSVYECVCVSVCVAGQGDCGRMDMSPSISFLLGSAPPCLLLPVSPLTCPSPPQAPLPRF